MRVQKKIFFWTFVQKAMGYRGSPSSFSFAGHGAVGNNGLGFVFYQIR
jgi:hypothetical protein